MRRTVFACTAAILVLLLPREGAAQDNPRFGIVMAFPAEIGVVWAVADRVAIRPDVNWTHSTTETTVTSAIFGPLGVTTTSVSTTSRTTNVGAGVSVLILVLKRDALRTYVAPRFGYAWSSLDLSIPAVQGVVLPVPSGTTSSTYNVSGSFGAQYALGRHFGVFGEAGVAYGHTTQTPMSILRSENRNTNTALRSGVGVILYIGS
jgi:hypothetical protein